MGRFGEKTREARLRWYGHVRRKDVVFWEKDAEDGVARKEETGKAKQEDMAEVEVTEEDTEDRNNWRRKILCGDPWWEKPKEEEIEYCEKLI